jgi:divalent metal cation (Fe/Co/Zn/Cd) transporter
LLLVIAGFLTIEMKSLLIGEGATESHFEAIRAALSSSPGVVRIIDLRTQHIGPEEVLVAGKVEFDRSLTVPELTDAIDGAESAMRTAVPYATRIYLEPDMWNDSHVPTPDALPDREIGHRDSPGGHG